MKRSPIFRLLILLLTLAVGLSVVQAQTLGNLLTNPGFEEPFEPVSSEMPSAVAQGWTAWHLNTADNMEPEYYPASDMVNGMGTPRIHSGSDAQQYFTFFAPHVGGVYQTVSGVAAGEELQFSVYAYVWTSTSDSPDTSDSDSDMTVQVGIDPAGGTDSTSDTIVWSEVAPSYDQYDQYSVTAAAAGESVTVYVRSMVNKVAMNNVVYLDDAELVSLGGAQASATEMVALTETIEMTPEIRVTVEQTLEVIPVDVIPLEEITPEITEEATTEAVSTAIVIEPATMEASSELPTEVPTDVPTDIPTLELSTATPTEIPTEVPTAAPTEVPATATEVPPTEIPPSPTPSPTLNVAVFPYTMSYTIVRGDTVAQIATRYGSTVEAIIIANQLDAQAHIFETQLLMIPLTVPFQPTTPPTATIPPPPTLIPTNAPLPTAAPIIVEGAQQQIIPVLPSVVTATLVTTRYVVTYNDTLSMIAVRFGTTTRELAQLNGIVNPNLIYTGQVLKIPATGSPTFTPIVPTVISPTATLLPLPTATQIAGQIYQVQPGDNLYRISIRFNVPIVELIRINGIYDASRIYVGQLLILP